MSEISLCLPATRFLLPCLHRVFLSDITELAQLCLQIEFKSKSYTSYNKRHKRLHISAKLRRHHALKKSNKRGTKTVLGARCSFLYHIYHATSSNILILLYVSILTISCW